MNRGGPVGSGAADHQRHKKCAEDSRDRSGGSADQPSQADLFDAPLKKDNCAAESESTQCGCDSIGLERSQEIGASTENNYEDDANNNEVDQLAPPRGAEFTHEPEAPTQSGENYEYKETPTGGGRRL